MTKIVKELRARGVYVVKLHGHAMQISGLQDLICCFRGRYIGLEVKTARGLPTELQLHTLDEIRAAGGVAAVVRSVAEVITIFERMELTHVPAAT